MTYHEYIEDIGELNEGDELPSEEIFNESQRIIKTYGDPLFYCPDFCGGIGLEYHRNFRELRIRLRYNSRYIYFLNGTQDGVIENFTDEQLKERIEWLDKSF